MKEILAIAQSLIQRLNKENTLRAEYKYEFHKPPKEFFESWYFDCEIHHKKNTKAGNIHWGGAPGLIIMKQSKKGRYN